MTGDQIIRANLFIALFMITYLSGALVLSLDNIGVYEALGYSQAMLTNTGSFAGDVLATVSPADFSALSKAAMCLLMVAGRLEIYPFIMIFMRSFWRPDKLY
jgi:trk system potassium uptake protein TrkH